MQTDILLEKVLHLDPQRERREPQHLAGASETSKATLGDNFHQQEHTYPKETLPPNPSQVLPLHDD